LNVKRSDTIEAIKVMIQEKEAIATDMQIIKFRNSGCKIHHHPPLWFWSCWPWCGGFQLFLSGLGGFKRSSSRPSPAGEAAGFAGSAVGPANPGRLGNACSCKSSFAAGASTGPRRLVPPPPWLGATLAGRLPLSPRSVRHCRLRPRGVWSSLLFDRRHPQCLHRIRQAGYPRWSPRACEQAVNLPRPPIQFVHSGRPSGQSRNNHMHANVGIISLFVIIV
jgi:hypothetical protein